MSKDNLIPSIDLDNQGAHARPNPMIWEGEEEAQGVFIGPSSQEDALALLGVPTLELPEVLRLPEDFEASPELRVWLASLQDAVAAAVNGKNATTGFDGLTDLDIQAIEEILGAGEVDGRVTLDGVRYEIQESLLAGVWRINGDNGSRWVEVGESPSVIADAAAALQLADYDIPAASGNVMNAPAVLSEIRERSRAWQETGEPNHVLNFTLFPMSEADHDMLTAVLGRADLELKSGGFGDCRIMATRYRHVWAVQFVNAMENTILDTIEIGRLPAAARAAREDFEDSSERLAERVETYLA